jgi:hypothetical protein
MTNKGNFMNTGKIWTKFGNVAVHLQLLAITAIAMVGCAQEPSSSVDQTKIYTSYTAYYDDTSKSLNATATFYFGGTTGTYLSLDGGSSVEFNSTLLSSSTDLANQVEYDGSWNNLGYSPAGGTFSFIYTNNAGTVFTNRITLPTLPVVQYSTLSVCESTSLAINWTSPNPIGSDSLSWVLNKTSGSGSGSDEITGFSSQAVSGSYTIPASNFQNLGPGQYQLQVCRQTRPQIQNAPSAGGDLSGASCTTQSTITVSNC